MFNELNHLQDARNGRAHGLPLLRPSDFKIVSLRWLTLFNLADSGIWNGTFYKIIWNRSILHHEYEQWKMKFMTRCEITQTFCFPMSKSLSKGSRTITVQTSSWHPDPGDSWHTAYGKPGDGFHPDAVSLSRDIQVRTIFLQKPGQDTETFT